MSLATRCTSCGIVFRVVQDQLKVSEGWVRCGRCDAVFNALQGLFDLDLEQPPPWPASPPAASPAASPGAASPSAAAGTGTEPAHDVRPDSVAYGVRSSDGSAPSERVLQRDRNDFEDARFNTELMLDDGVLPAQEPPPEPVAPSAAEPRDELPAVFRSPGDSPDALAEASSAEPSFLQRAEQDARWQRPVLRQRLRVAGTVLAVLLVVQGVHHFRDGIAARWPAMLPALGAWCGLWHCAIDAPRRLQDLTVESSGLTETGVGSNSFKLSLTLRNRGNAIVSLPAVELSVSDVNGQLVSRKALRAADFGVTSNVIQSGADLPLQLTLTSAGPKVSGYTVEIFYP